MTLRELLTTIEDSRNWTDEFLEENEDMIVQHYNDIRKHLGSQGAYIAFDRAFTERKRPGQVALMDSRDIRRTDTNLKNSNFDDRNVKKRKIFDNLRHILIKFDMIICFNTWYIFLYVERGIL